MRAVAAKSLTILGTNFVLLRSKMTFHTNRDMANWAGHVVKKLDQNDADECVLRYCDEKRMNNTRTPDEYSMWMNYSRPGTMSDEHLIEAGVSEITLKPGNRCLRLAMVNWVVGYERKYGDSMDAEGGREEAGL